MGIIANVLKIVVPKIVAKMVNALVPALTVAKGLAVVVRRALVADKFNTDRIKKRIVCLRHAIRFFVYWDM